MIFTSPQLLLNMNFSSRTTSMDVQRNVESNVEKRTKDTYGPPPGKRLIIFVDDMNMPQVSCIKINWYLEYLKVNFVTDRSRWFQRSNFDSIVHQ